LCNSHDEDGQRRRPLPSGSDVDSVHDRRDRCDRRDWCAARAALTERGAPHRLIVRDAGRAPTGPGEVVDFGGYGDPAGMRRAFDGVSTLFLCSAREAQDRVEQHRSAVDAAIAAGVARIVYLSFVGAARDATFTFYETTS